MGAFKAAGLRSSLITAIGALAFLAQMIIMIFALVKIDDLRAW